MKDQRSYRVIITTGQLDGEGFLATATIAENGIASAFAAETGTDEATAIANAVKKAHADIITRRK